MSKKKPTKKKEEEEEEEEEPEEEEWQSSASECATSGRALIEEQSCLRTDSVKTAVIITRINLQRTRTHNKTRGR